MRLSTHYDFVVNNKKISNFSLKKTYKIQKIKTNKFKTLGVLSSLIIFSKVPENIKPTKPHSQFPYKSVAAVIHERKSAD